LNTLQIHLFQLKEMTLLQQNFVTAKPINFYYLVCKLDRVQYRIHPISFLLMSLDLVECASRASARNKKPPAMRVGDKNYIKKASFALRCRCSSQSQ
ncbi:hypothetical protein, partial [Limosilactobacillus reuteri]|uniref:hypothetical protein n=1 Tax=Limosilactobacillus reuteri TaxID=1598 RepID=UPI001CDC33A2